MEHTAYQILNPGIAYWFTAAGDAVVGYVEKCGVRIVAGAPMMAIGQAIWDAARTELRWLANKSAG